MKFAVLRCRARLKTKLDTLTILNSEHNHEVISKARKYGSLKRQRAEAEAAARAERGQNVAGTADENVDVAPTPETLQPNIKL